MDLTTFENMYTAGKSYYITPKHRWGMDPSEHDEWSEISEVMPILEHCMEEQQAQLCWQKQDDCFQTFFIVWW